MVVSQTISAPGTFAENRNIPPQRKHSPNELIRRELKNSQDAYYSLSCPSDELLCAIQKHKLQRSTPVGGQLHTRSTLASRGPTCVSAVCCSCRNSTNPRGASIRRHEDIACKVNKKNKKTIFNYNRQVHLANLSAWLPFYSGKKCVRLQLGGDNISFQRRLCTNKGLIHLEYGCSLLIHTYGYTIWAVSYRGFSLFATTPKRLIFTLLSLPPSISSKGRLSYLIKGSSPPMVPSQCWFTVKSRFVSCSRTVSFMSNISSKFLKLLLKLGGFTLRMFGMIMQPLLLGGVLLDAEAGLVPALKLVLAFKFVGVSLPCVGLSCFLCNCCVKHSDMITLIDINTSQSRFFNFKSLYIILWLNNFIKLWINTSRCK